MDAKNVEQRTPQTSAGMDHSEELLAEVDEPPDEFKSFSWSPTKLHSNYTKSIPLSQRRESLLTRQLHSETEHTTDEERVSPPPRALSTQSTWSNPSTASTCELTSDDGRSVPSPAFSPPLPPSQARDAMPVVEKPLDQKVKIVGQDEDVTPPSNQAPTSEKTVEAGLGRKRCISFACRGKQEAKPIEPPASEPVQSKPASPPKRKCMLKFACPTRSGAESKPAEKTQAKRNVSPPPPERRSSVGNKHRGSDSTVTHMSPKSVRKTSLTSTEKTTQQTSQPVTPARPRRYSNDSGDEHVCKEATRFHEFGASEEEQEDWVQESSCHRARLTINDTLKKENLIRKTCEEVEEEALEEEEDIEADDLEDELEAVDELDEDDLHEEMDEENESDEGFHSDDEDGFASDDSEDEGSDFEWWKPGPASTAPTSVEHLDRLAIVNSQHHVPSSSLGSASSNHHSPGNSRHNLSKISSRTPAMAINRANDDIPDSTDFVCGTLDEDRPLEQAWIARIKRKKAAKRGVRPQDIDPTFPTSDPEMDEEDDDDVDEVAHSEEEGDDFMHGDLEELDGEEELKPTPLARRRTRSSTHRSPPPSVTRIHSPPPPSKMRGTCRSPPPPGQRRSTARSPPPRKLFGGASPKRMRSPAPMRRMTSPQNSPTNGVSSFATAPRGLAGRPQPTHTASLPRGGGLTLTTMSTIGDRDRSDDSDTAVMEIPKRGAIDIVKGLERKRQWRKRKMHQKLCAKAAAKGEKPIKVKPGKGAERMREVGLQLQQYQGKAEHILSM